MRGPDQSGDTHWVALVVSSSDFKSLSPDPKQGHFRALGVQNEFWGQSCSCSHLPPGLFLAPPCCSVPLVPPCTPLLSSSTPEVSQSRTVIMSVP